MFGWSIFFDWLYVVYHAHFTFTDIENDTWQEECKEFNENREFNEFNNVYP